MRLSGLRLVYRVRVLVTLERVKSGVKAMSTSTDCDGSMTNGSQLRTLKPKPSQGWPSISNPEMWMGVRPVFFALKRRFTVNTGGEYLECFEPETEN